MWSGRGAGVQQQSLQRKQNSSINDDARIISDVLGLHSKENITVAVAETRAALATIPTSEKVALDEAQRSNPQLFDDEHVLQFLWAENFDAPVSSIVIVVRGVCNPTLDSWFP
jgi:hypothetical protein